MGNLLFSPSGRIGPADFMRGTYVLIAISLLINLLPMVSTTLATMMSLVLLVVMYCWVALFIKRYHDGSKSGWMVLIPAFVFAIISLIISNMVPLIFAPELYAELQTATEEAMSGGNLIGAMMEISKEYAEPLAKKIALPKSFIQAFASFAIAFLFNVMIKHDPNTNQYGAP